MARAVTIEIDATMLIASAHAREDAAAVSGQSADDWPVLYPDSPAPAIIHTPSENTNKRPLNRSHRNRAKKRAKVDPSIRAESLLAGAAHRPDAAARLPTKVAVATNATELKHARPGFTGNAQEASTGRVGTAQYWVDEKGFTLFQWDGMCAYPAVFLSYIYAMASPSERQLCSSIHLDESSQRLPGAQMSRSPSGMKLSERWLTRCAQSAKQLRAPSALRT
jgi:hypothetical protein